MYVDKHHFKNVVQSIIESYPKVSGGEQYLSNDANKSSQKVLDYSKKHKNRFVSIEHLLLGV